MRNFPILTNIFQMGWNHQLVFPRSFSFRFFSVPFERKPQKLFAKKGADFGKQSENLNV